MRKFSWTILLFTLFISSFAQAKLFRNAYVSFELPPLWQCHIENTVWICRSKDSKSAREAIIMLTAKEVGPMDSLAQYQNYLRQRKTISDNKGKPIVSTVKHVKSTKISNHNWVDSFHLNSETPNYYTRYLATTKGRIAILVTFSAHTKIYTKYAHQFLKAIQSLRVVATKNLLNQPSYAPIGGAKEQLGLGIGSHIPDDLVDEAELDEYEDEEDDNTSIFALIVILAAIGGYLFVKKQKK